MQIIRWALNQDETVSVRGYLHDDGENSYRKSRPCVVICPGGGYAHCSEREQDPPALALFAAGYQVFILLYSLNENASGMRPLMELSDTVMRIREKAGEWHIDPDKIAVMGFSAGGHLAASLGTLWNHEALRAKMDTKGGANRPNALILCYPVITSGPHRHAGSIDRISGGDAEQSAFFSLENRVTPETPPTFLWHTQDDASVPVENALLFLTALRQNKVPFEAHIFQSGQHGLSMCNEEVGTLSEACAPWMGLCLTWLSNQFAFRS